MCNKFLYQYTDNKQDSSIQGIRQSNMHIVNQKTHGMIWLCGTRHSGSFEQTDLDLDRLRGSTLDSPVPVVLHNFN